MIFDKNNNVWSRTLGKLYVLRYFIALIISLQLLFFISQFRSNSKIMPYTNGNTKHLTWKQSYDDLMGKTATYIIQRVLNPMFVFDTPRSWQGPVLPTLELFPNHRLLQDNWKIIRDEAMVICNQSSPLLQPAAKASPAAFASLSKYATTRGNDSTPTVYWKTAILKFYGEKFPNVISACPKTMALLSKLPNVDVAMFSVMEPGATIPVHRGPLRGAVRYHLPLIVPGYDYDGKELPQYTAKKPGTQIATNKNDMFQYKTKSNWTDTTSQKCHIVVGEDLDHHYGRMRGNKKTSMIEGTSFAKSFPTYEHAWVPGEGVLFDDTYAHSVANHHPSKSRRIVLFLDVRRPSAVKRNHYFNFGPTLFSLIRWTGLPVTLFFQNAKNEKAIFRKPESKTGRRLQSKIIDDSYNHIHI